MTAGRVAWGLTAPLLTVAALTGWGAASSARFAWRLFRAARLP